MVSISSKLFTGLSGSRSHMATIGSKMVHLLSTKNIFKPPHEKTKNVFFNRSDKNQVVQPQKTARSLKFRIQEEEGLYFPSSINKGADQHRGYREADLRLCFRRCKLLVFS